MVYGYRFRLIGASDRGTIETPKGSAFGIALRGVRRLAAVLLVRVAGDRRARAVGRFLRFLRLVANSPKRYFFRKRLRKAADCPLRFIAPG